MTGDIEKQLSEQEGNRRFSLAMIALENGDFTKSERLLVETAEIMGKNHPVGMLAMKTRAGILSERGQAEEALQATLDLLEAQITTFGVNHAESSRTIRNIMDMCKDQGRDDVASDIAMMVQVASEIEREQQTASFKRLRTTPEEEAIAKESLRYKIQKWVAGRLARLLKLFPLLDPEKGALIAPYLLIGSFFIAYGILGAVGLSSPNRGVEALRDACIEYTTADMRKRLNFTSAATVVFQIDSQTYSAPFRVIGYSWHDVGTLTTSSLLDRENWLIQVPEGLRDFNNNLFYRVDAPEREIVHHMNEVMNTSNYYFEHKTRYPKSVEQISETGFQYLNPFSREMERPVIQSLRMDGEPPSAVADLVWSLKNGSTWPDEPPLKSGAVHALRIMYGSPTQPKQQFFIHGCDRHGKLLTASEGFPLLLESENGDNVEAKGGVSLPQRTPTFWVIKVPPGFSPDAVQYLKYRFAVAYGVMTFVMLLLFLLTPDKRAKAGAAVFLVCLVVTLAVSLFGVFAP